MIEKNEPLDELDTPFVAIDLDKAEHNLRRWQTYCDEHGLRNRPHIKTHKLIEMAALQIELRAIGLACQKLSEARAMIDGLSAVHRDRRLDVMIPYNIVGSTKAERAAALAGTVDLTLACDALEVVRPLAQAFAAAGKTASMIVEFDSGAGRCGVSTVEEAVALALEIERMPGARYAGLMTYPPAGAASRVRAFFADTMAELAGHGIETAIRSNGGTPDMWRAHEVDNATEHRAGTFIYYDRMQVAAGAAGLDDCALRVHATVVSRHGDRAAIDAGSKALTSDMGKLEGHGLIWEYPEVRITKLSEEHGHLDLSAASAKPRVGERVTIVPNHACPVSNLFDRVVGVRGGRVERVLRVAARGCVT
ncbi:MAG: alanine racemase [Geminicoccaceae bacterium]|nr:alanine racemase [Geminicoccaceae bacterium]